MDNLWILTEEKPKSSVIKQIIDLYVKDFGGVIENYSNIKIRPVIEGNIFKFYYLVEGISLLNIKQIIIKTVSGNSSFFDFLVFKQEDQPEEKNSDNLVMAIEETKTSDDESRNTGVYQRASKFVYIDSYYADVKKYMLYNEELEERKEKKPSDTSIFGTNMLLTIGTTIIGKDPSKWCKKFESIDDMIYFKSLMRKPPEGNVPIEITKFEERIEVSGRLSKPAEAGNIGHDPNIGALSIISKCLRYLGWNKRIVITKHGVSQEYVTKTRGKNKFLYICKMLNLELEGIDIPSGVSLPEDYWHYEMSSEKMASILLHIAGEYNGLKEVYQNHAGCERGYFKTKSNQLIALPKKDKHNVNLYIPDLILYDPINNEIILVEGKKLSTLNIGLDEIKNYDSIENEFIKIYYEGAKIVRWLSIFGGHQQEIPHQEVLIYLNEEGEIFLNNNTPDSIKQAFNLLNT